MSKKSVRLNGKKPLWDNLQAYLNFINLHMDEIYDKYLEDDENAELIVQIISLVPLISENARATLMIVTEHYISDYYPEIAVIAGDYPKT